MSHYTGFSRGVGKSVLLTGTALFLFSAFETAFAGESDFLNVGNIAYKSGTSLSDYENERCKLDLFLPADVTEFPSLVWFHGGSLTSGSKDGLKAIAETFTARGIAFVAVNYRLSPTVTFPAYLDDSAAAFAWVHKHIVQYGGDANKIFIGGHSAGAYLSALVGMDSRFLRKYQLSPDAVAGFILISGQMMTHFTVRREQGIDAETIIADQAAPIYHTRKDLPPFLILMGDQDWPARWEENRYFVAAQNAAGNNDITIHQIAGRDHSSIVSRLPEAGDPVAKAMIDFMARPPLRTIYPE